MSPGIAASAVSSLNLHFTEFEKISVAWVKVKSASHTSLWLARSFCILCMSLIFSLKNHISSDWHIWALSLSYASTDSSFPLMKNKEGRSHIGNSLHGRASLPRHPSLPCAWLSVILPFIRKPCVTAMLGARCKEEWRCLPWGAAEKEPSPRHPNFIPLPYSHGCGSLGGLWWRGEIVLLPFCFVCAATGVWILTRPGHGSTAIVQTTSSANCALSGSRGTLQSRLAGQRKALLCEVYRNSESLSWVPSAQLSAVVAPSF